VARTPALPDFLCARGLPSPNRAGYGAASGEAAFEAVPRAIPPQGGQNGNTACIPSPEGEWSSAGCLDKEKAARLSCDNATDLTSTHWDYLKLPREVFYTMQPADFADIPLMR
jgi:hypothetical protein